MAQGSHGELTAFNDFLSPTDIVVITGATDLGGGVSLIGVNEGVLASTMDEPNGVLDITTDTADNDNHALVSGKYKPANGGTWMEARFKISDSVATTRAAVFVGFSETMALDTPVMPAERATATTTYNGTGGMLGVLFDSDSTLLEFFAVAGDAGVALATKNARGAVGNANGIQLTGTAGIPGGASATADKWYIVRVEIGDSGLGRVYFGAADASKELVFVAENTVALDPTAVFTAVAMIENRSAANERLEVDYFKAHGFRSWAP